MSNVLNFLHWLALLAAIWNTCAVLKRTLAYNLAVRDKLLMLRFSLQGKVPVLRIKIPFILAVISWLWVILV